ncbi:MAG: fused MFS/spermidine synthase [Burkholderiaceae bacterium]|nr:fused MFS/spermidine synthase [Burkholderiaceae bacterium]
MTILHAVPSFRLLRRFRAAAAMLALLAAAPAHAETVVHVERSALQTIVVVDGDGRRCMRFAEASTALNQSCYALDDPARLAFSYTRAMVAVALQWQPPPRRVLVIGVGGGSIPMALAQWLPQARIEAVDIDPAVIAVAERYFGLRPDARLRTIAADGREYVRQARRAGRRYDAVLLDAFDNDGIPPALFDRTFLADVRGLLSADGVFLANTFAGSPSYAAESATAEAVFGSFLNIKLGGVADGNRLLVAGRGRLPSPEMLLTVLPARRAAFDAIGATEAWLRSWRFAGRDWAPVGR